LKKTPKGKIIAQSLIAISTLSLATASFAEDGFRTHFASAGTLGENIFTSEVNPSTFFGVGYKQATADKLTDGSGNVINQVALRPGLTIPLDYLNKANIKYIYGGFTSETQVAGGRITAGLVVPYTTFDKSVTLGPGGPLPAAVSLPNSSANVHGLDDAEVGGSWDIKSDNTKYSVGLALTSKTGGYKIASNGASIGQGYYTWKPSFAAITQNGAFSFAYKGTLGLNTNNSEANYHSGNLLSLEAALGYKTGVGAFGFKLHSLRQYQSDSGTGVASNNPYPWLATSGVSAPQADGNRISYLTGSLFYTVPVKPIESIFYVGVTTMKNPEYTTVPRTGYFETRLTRAFN
jgi:Putative MetA-pathway of phenol degradation